MRLAIVSDIHGNLTALEAVIADLRPTTTSPALASIGCARSSGTERVHPGGARTRSPRLAAWMAEMLRKAAYVDPPSDT